MTRLIDRARKRHEEQMAKRAATESAPPVAPQDPVLSQPFTRKIQTGGATAAAVATVAALPIKETIPVKLTDLHVRPGYERHPSEFSGPAWDEFVASIAVSKGNVQPIDVRRVRGGHTLYQIIAGERRFRALTQLEIPFAICAVRDLDEERADFIHDTENAKRADKSPFSLAMQLSVMHKSGRYANQVDLAEKAWPR
jgi:ParB/RepB/Spo0J family partition protein